MPPQPAWIHQLPEILAALKAMSAPYLDRHAVGKLFGVGERRARQLMVGVEGMRIGNAHAIDRASLIRRLEATSATDRVQHAVRRRARISTSLEQSRRALAARRVLLTPPSSPANADLPEGVELFAQTLCISFTSAEDLASKLFSLSQVMAEDWVVFVELVERTIRR